MLPRRFWGVHFSTAYPVVTHAQKRRESSDTDGPRGHHAQTRDSVSEDKYRVTPLIQRVYSGPAGRSSQWDGGDRGRGPEDLFKGYEVTATGAEEPPAACQAAQYAVTCKVLCASNWSVGQTSYEASLPLRADKHRTKSPQIYIHCACKISKKPQRNNK